MEQWHDIRGRIAKDTLLFFRLGDFYEIFNEDAVEGARILGITQTHRHGLPMAGIPYHAANAYIGKILNAGRKVAIVDQVETPKAGKLVKRELTRIITPGTILESKQQEERTSQYILALSMSRQGLHTAWMDLTTGEFVIAQQSLFQAEQLLPVISALNPREVLLPESGIDVKVRGMVLEGLYSQLGALLENRLTTELPDYQFDPVAGQRAVLETLKVLNLEGFGIEPGHPSLGPAGALVEYVTETLCKRPEHISRISEHRSGNVLLVDPATQRNLEIFKGAGQTRQGSLIEAMDATVTAAGARHLETILARPVMDLPTVRWRQDIVGVFTEVPSSLFDIQQLLKQIRDIPRILSRLQNRIQNPREIGGIRDTLDRLPDIQKELQAINHPLLESVINRIENFDTLTDLLDLAVNEDLPGTIQDGGTIKEGFDEELDYLRSLTRDNKTWLADLENTEQETTGIRNLKVKYNGAFGYFIEVTKANLSLVPEHYIRKQTMTNAERFTTDELKTKEKEILNAEELALAREETLFRELISEILGHREALMATSDCIAELDIYCGWAQIAREWNYCKPVVDDSDTLAIEAGRHPVVEQKLQTERLGLAGTHKFVPNDCKLESSCSQIALITGPNMAGKSTYIRQIGLITLMAQVGAWVPADSCQLGLVDRIFSRVGASDELARGNSTFMVEMNETANILNNCTERSLIILDEIGRGTSTYDGLSIAWAVVEHLHGETDEGPRTLFATHYHELTKLTDSLPRMRNFSVAVKEWNDEIIFVRQVVPGAADRSYGIQVARLAGLPDSVIQRAKGLLETLEAGNEDATESKESPTLPGPKKKSRKAQPDSVDEDTSDASAQLELF